MLISTTDLRVLAFPSELGWMAIAICDDVVKELTFGLESPQAAARSLMIMAEPAETVSPRERLLISRLQAFAAGQPDDFKDVELDLAGMTAFNHRVVANCRKIGYGRTMTYAQLAAKSGSPNAARAVGNAMASNRFPLIVPCHRVVGTGGSLGGYSAPSGLQMKQRLLALEGSLAQMELSASTF